MPSNAPSRSPPEGDAVLIAAQSGRALAAAARRAGLRPFVADLFGDTDTLALSAGYRSLRGRLGRGLDADGTAAALRELAAEAGASIGLVLGSGFEADPDFVDRLAGEHRLIGSDGDTLRLLKDPMAFAVLLARLGVPHPPVRLGPVADPTGWLTKRRGGSGGGHIRPAAAGRLPPRHYLQRRVPGTPAAIAFLADGRRAAGLATTRQWTDPAVTAPFRFGGAVEPFEGSPRVLAAATAALDGIVAASGLRGLASADLLVDGETWWLLEINPRPGGTLDILDRRAIPLFALHLEASLCRLPTLPPPAAGAAASAIVYARRTILAPCLAPCEEGAGDVRDRPAPGSRIAAGAPVCTVVAAGTNAAAAVHALRRQVDAVHARLQERRGLDHATAPPPAERQRSRSAPRRGADR